MCTFKTSYTYIGNTFYQYPNKPILIKLTKIVVIHMCTAPRSTQKMYLEVHVYFRGKKGAYVSLAYVLHRTLFSQARERERERVVV